MRPAARAQGGKAAETGARAARARERVGGAALRAAREARQHLPAALDLVSKLKEREMEGERGVRGGEGVGGATLGSMREAGQHLPASLDLLAKLQTEKAGVKGRQGERGGGSGRGDWEKPPC